MTADLTWVKPGPGAWTYDGAHNVGPVTPLLQATFPAAMADGFRSFTARYGLPISHIEVRYVNDLAYGSVQIAGVPTSDRPAPPAAALRLLTRLHPEFRRRNRAARLAVEQRLWRTDLDRWFGELRPARLASLHSLQAIDPSALGDGALADHVGRCVAELAAGLCEHFSLVGASGLPVGMFLMRERDRGRAPSEAIADLTGAAADSTAATLSFLDAIVDAVTAAGVTPASIDDVRSASPAAAAALDRYLDEYGQRVVGAFDVTGRRLVELPDVVMRSISAAARRVQRPAAAPGIPAVGDVRWDDDRIDDPVVDDARLAIASRDDHAGISCMWPLGLVRRAVLAAGERLQAVGALDRVEQALLCEVTEIDALLRRSDGRISASSIATRAADRARLIGVVPPPVLGDLQPPPDPAVFPRHMRRVAAGMAAFLELLETSPLDDAGGVGIGHGVHRGRAVVAVDPEDAAARIQPGDVLVTATTTPAFNSVLPIAGALVTAHGGPMSHAGIAARELGIPAVVGALGVLERIPDGALIEVDPAAATVRIVEVHVAIAPGMPSASLDNRALGGKGAGLMTMAELGLPVPPAVVLPVGFHPMAVADDLALEAAVRAAVADLEAMVGRRLGDRDSPLLVSVRSGAAVSMPGMMDTLLDVGMVPSVRDALEREAGRAFADDTERRFRDGYLGVVDGPPPADPIEQVLEATRAVYRSWNSDRARAFRRREGLDDASGTAVIVQSMVFGNRGSNSGTGVVFSRDPSTGRASPIGDVLVGAQGDDVVSGTHSTLALDDLATRWPDAHAELLAALERLEHHHTDMVDVEFTIDDGTLFLLQCRPGRRSAVAAMRIAIDLADDPAFAVSRIDAVARCAELLGSPPLELARIDDEVVATHAVARGLAASPGRGAGALTVSIDDALRRHDAGERVVLVRRDTTPADVAGLAVADGIVTVTGGLVSHAAVVARSWGVPAVVGAHDLIIDDGGVTAAGRRIEVGEIVTVDGTTGVLLAGDHRGEGLEAPELEILRRWQRDGAARTAVPGPTTEPADGAVVGLDVVRFAVIRGRIDPAGVAVASGISERAALVEIRRLVDDGLLQSVGEAWTPTPSGRAVVAAATAAEVEVHGVAFAALLDRFAVPDRAMKELVTRWQLDEASADVVAARLLDTVHETATPVLADAAARVPRLARYRVRLDGALARVAGGDHRYLAHPAVDSYHGVWFELHEELIGLAGTTRAAEVDAGRA